MHSWFKIIFCYLFPVDPSLCSGRICSFPFLWSSGADLESATLASRGLAIAKLQGVYGNLSLCCSWSPPFRQDPAWYNQLTLSSSPLTKWKGAGPWFILMCSWVCYSASGQNRCSLFTFVIDHYCDLITADVLSCCESLMRQDSPSLATEHCTEVANWVTHFSVPPLMTAIFWSFIQVSLWMGLLVLWDAEAFG